MNYSMVFDLFRCQSKTDETLWYTVYYLGDDTWQCTCPGFRYRKGCKHIRFIQVDQEEISDD